MSPEGHQVAGTPSKRAKSHGLGRAGIFRKMQYIQCQDRMRMATITMAPSISTQYDRYRVYFVTKSFLSDPSKTMEINQSFTRAQLLCEELHIHVKDGRFTFNSWPRLGHLRHCGRPRAASCPC